MLLFFFSPAILLLLTVPLWFSAKLSNERVQTIATVLFCLPAILMLLADPVDRAGGSQNVLAKAFLILGTFICSGGFLLLYDKMLHTKRCPHCRKLSLKLIRKEQDIHTQTTVRTRRYEDRKGRFVKSWDTITTFTTYNMWCPECLEHTQWETENVEHLQSKERRV